MIGTVIGAVVAFPSPVAAVRRASLEIRKLRSVVALPIIASAIVFPLLARARRQP